MRGSLTTWSSVQRSKPSSSSLPLSSAPVSDSEADASLDIHDVPSSSSSSLSGTKCGSSSSSSSSSGSSSARSLKSSAWTRHRRCTTHMSWMYTVRASSSAESASGGQMIGISLCSSIETRTRMWSPSTGSAQHALSHAAWCKAFFTSCSGSRADLGSQMSRYRRRKRRVGEG